MLDFLISYGADIAKVTAIAAIFAPFIRSRVVSDKNMLLKFGDLKELASKVSFKEKDITNSIFKINVTVDKLQKDVNDSIKRIDDTVLAFTQDELYTKMLAGLSQLDELNQVLQNKDNTIADYKTQLKKINKRLGVMESERKL